MVNELTKKDFIEQTAPLFSFMCRSQQWDGLTERKIKEWLSNFTDIDGQFLAHNILKKCIYYSESDILSLLRYGLEDLVYGRDLREEIIKTIGIQTTGSVYSSHIKSKKDKSFFIPLLDKNKPHESGQQMIRYLVQNGMVQSSQTAFHGVTDPNQLDGYEYLFIVDDCIGSGQQIYDFWNSPDIQSLKNKAIPKGIKCYYLTLVAYRENLAALHCRFNDLSIVACDILTDKHRVFSEQSVYWQDKPELDFARDYFIRLQKERGIQMFGWGGLDFALVIHRNIPDWSLPIFWQQNKGCMLKHLTANSSGHCCRIRYDKIRIQEKLKSDKISISVRWP